MSSIVNPYDGTVIADIADSSEADVRAAIDRAQAAAPALAALPAHRRGTILNTAAALIEADAKAIAGVMAQESGKPIRYARGEVARAVETFQFAADEARQLHGETIPMDAAKGGIGRFGYFMRVPVGIVAAITPFNFPLNLVAHKVAPAVAAGCPIVLKPAPATPLTALRLAAILREAGLPAGSYEVVPGGADVGIWLTTDPRTAMISFTGSPGVAREISKTAGLRRTVWELGGNAALIVDTDTDVKAAVARAIIGGYAYSGQTCISIQRIYIHRSQYAEFRDRYAEAAARLVTGDPLDERTELGPVITRHAAERIDAWIAEAVAGGAQVITGGVSRGGQMLPATVLEGVTPDMRVIKDEIFGPVVSLLPFDDFDAAIDAVNDSVYGLQTGVYTGDLRKAMRAADRLHVGGVMINDVPTFRADHMPYGGVKDSGVGREGPRFAIEEMTVTKLVVISM